MLRGALDSILLFLLPFAGYAVFVALQRRYPRTLATFARGPILRLVAAGLAMAILGTLLGGLFGNRYRGAYVPAHLDNGVLVPGHME